MSRARISDRVTEVYLAAGTLMFVGWGGMLALLLFTVPTVDARWMFFVLALSALTGTSIPFIILGRALTWNIALLIVSVIVAIEWLIEIRERSLWNPENVNEE